MSLDLRRPEPEFYQTGRGCSDYGAKDGDAGGRAN